MTTSLGRNANPPTGERNYLSIREVLELLIGDYPDVTISKIRFLEARGLIHPERTPSGYRKFYREDVDRLRWILRQQRENYLPLNVIKVRLDGGQVPGDPGSDAPSLFDDAPYEPPPVASANGDEASSLEQPLRDKVPTVLRGHPAEGTNGTRHLEIHRGSAGAARPATEKVASTEGSAPISSPGASVSGASVSGASVSGASVSGASVSTESVPVAPVVGAPAVAETAVATSKSLGSEIVPPAPATTPATVQTAPAHAGPAASVPARPEAPAAAPEVAAPPVTSPVVATAPAAPASRRPSREVARDGYSAPELALAIGAEPQFIAEIASYGLINGRDVGGEHCYDDDARHLAQIAYDFSRYGIEPRHLKSLQHAAFREAELFSQVVVPLLRQRNPEAREKAQSDLSALVSLGVALKSGFIQTELRNLTGG